MKWFKHKTNSSDREFLKEVENIFGLEGYARWFKLLEKIGSVMGGENGCSASYPWSDWQTFLKGKRNKLETFLEHLENKQRIKRKLTGNILEIECSKMLEIKDNYTTNLQVTNNKLSPRVKSKEIRVKSKDKKLVAKKPATPPKDPPEIQDSTKVERFWMDAYRDKYDSEPEWNFARDRKILKGLVDRHGLDEVIKRACIHIERGRMLSIPGFQTVFNDLINGPPPKQPTKPTTFQNKRAVLDDWLKESTQNDKRTISDGPKNTAQLRRREPGQGDTGGLVPLTPKHSP